MPVKIVIAASPVVVRVISSGPGWLTLLVTFLLGAALTLAVQIYVVPRVEMRKRRRERWEKDVLEMGELLTIAVTQLAQEARSAQLRARFTAELADDSPEHQEWVKRELRQLKPAAREAAQKLTDTIRFQSSWKMTQITEYRDSDMVLKYELAFARYGLHLVEHVWDDLQELPQTDFEAWWDRERELRTQLISSVRDLATDRHALRISWRLRLGRLKARARRLARARRKPVEASPGPLTERSAH